MVRSRFEPLPAASAGGGGDEPLQHPNHASIPPRTGPVVLRALRHGSRLPSRPKKSSTRVAAAPRHGLDQGSIPDDTETARAAPVAAASL